MRPKPKPKKVKPVPEEVPVKNSKFIFEDVPQREEKKEKSNKGYTLVNS